MSHSLELQSTGIYSVFKLAKSVARLAQACSHISDFKGAVGTGKMICGKS